MAIFEKLAKNEPNEPIFVKCQCPSLLIGSLFNLGQITKVHLLTCKIMLQKSQSDWTAFAWDRIFGFLKISISLPFLNEPKRYRKCVSIALKQTKICFIHKQPPCVTNSDKLAFSTRVQMSFVFSKSEKVLFFYYGVFFLFCFFGSSFYITTVSTTCTTHFEK
jgi:hypothetical protein